MALANHTRISDETQVTRRGLLAAAALPAILAVPAIAAAKVADTPEQQIAHHIAEAVRLLREAAPEGFEVQNIHWINCKGPEAPEEFVVIARTDREVAQFRPRYHEKWKIRTRYNDGVAIPIIG